MLVVGGKQTLAKGFTHYLLFDGFANIFSGHFEKMYVRKNYSDVSKPAEKKYKNIKQTDRNY